MLLRAGMHTREVGLIGIAGAGMYVLSFAPDLREVVCSVLRSCEDCAGAPACVRRKPAQTVCVVRTSPLRVTNARGES